MIIIITTIIDIIIGVVEVDPCREEPTVEWTIVEGLDVNGPFPPTMMMVMVVISIHKTRMMIPFCDDVEVGAQMVAGKNDEDEDGDEVPPAIAVSVAVAVEAARVAAPFIGVDEVAAVVEVLVEVPVAPAAEARRLKEIDREKFRFSIYLR